MFKKKNKKEKIIIVDEEVNPAGVFKDNVRTLKDAFAPSEIDVINPNTLKVGEHYVRSYVMQGYPSYVQVG